MIDAAERLKLPLFSLPEDISLYELHRPDL